MTYKQRQAGDGIAPLKGEMRLTSYTQVRVDMIVDVYMALIRRDVAELLALRAQCVRLGIDYLVDKIDKSNE